MRSTSIPSAHHISSPSAFSRFSSSTTSPLPLLFSSPHSGHQREETEKEADHRMGKPKSLKSSMRSIQEAVSNFKPIPPICMQQSKTDSFRDLYTSFNSASYTPLSSASSSSCGPTVQDPHGKLPLTGTSSFTLLRSLLEVDMEEEEEEEEEDKGGLDSSNSFCSSTSSSNHLEPSTNVPLCNRRFFFSPSTTKSIMEEASLESGRCKTQSFEDAPCPSPLEPEDFAAGKPCFCSGSVPTVLSSCDPYEDFRCSMQEMVEAHELRDWPGLQELVRSYLKLNDRKTHRIIMLAFMDLLIHFVSLEKDPHHHSHHFSSATPSSSSMSTSSSSYTNPILEPGSSSD